VNASIVGCRLANWRNLRLHNLDDDLLRILAWVPQDQEQDSKYYIRGRAADTCFSLDKSEKIRLEVARWRDALMASLPDPSRGRPLE
jgi:hypothetical protein